MRAEAPRSLRGLVQPKDLAEYVSVSEETFRVWRSRRQTWIQQGRPPSKAIYTLLPEPVKDPERPGEPFLFNGAYAYDVDDVVKLRAALAVHKGRAGNPEWAQTFDRGEKRG